MNKNNKLEFSCATFKGARETNQDSFYAAGVSSANEYSASDDCEGKTIKAFTVCDGIGSFAGSAEAAEVTAITTAETEKGSDKSDIVELLLESFEKAEIKTCAKSSASGNKTGTTVVSAVIRGNECVIGNIGDSPAFLLHDGTLRELSLRHNLAEEKRRKGIIPSETDKRYLLKAIGVGMPPSESAHVIRGTLSDGDMLLLCSDGITDAFDADGLKAALISGCSAEALAKEASEKKGADNCTAVIIKYHNISED